MEIQGLSLLSDIKISLKKKLFRHIINLVERKLQKDYSKINSDHFIQIILYETKAVHGLLDTVIIGKFEKKIETVQKLLKIMNRNMQICLHTFQKNMGLFMLHLDNMKIRNTAFERPLSSVNIYMKQYLSVLLNSCFYTHILRMRSGANLFPTQQFIAESKIILRNFALIDKHSYHHSIIKIQTLLLIMALNIKNSNYQQAKEQFYEAIAEILCSLKAVQIKSNHRNQLKMIRRRCQLFNLLVTALINNQRSLIECDILIGWEIGFNLLRSIQKQIRFEQTGWRKYIRKQYEYNQIIQVSKMGEIRQVYIPFVTKQSSAIKMLTQSFKQTKNYTSNPLLFQNFICTKKRRQHKKTLYSTKMECTQILQDLNDQPVMYIVNTPKTKRDHTKVKNNDQKHNDSVAKIKFFEKMSDNKSLKFSKECSISQYETNRPRSNFIKNAFNNENQKQNIKRKTQRKEQRLLGSDLGSSSQKLTITKSKKSKKVLLNMSDLLNKTHFIQLFDQKLKLKCDLMRLKKQNKIIHHYISQQISVNNLHQFTLNIDKNKSEIKIAEEHKMDNKSLQINLLDNFIQLLCRNKKKLKIQSLAEKYDLAKKKKKIRDYNVQMIEYQLNKSISKLFIKNSILKPSSNSLNKTPNLSILGQIFNQSKYFKSKQEQQKNLIDQKKLANAHNKSKEVITQMLKKITHASSFQSKRNSRTSLQKNSISCFKFNVID